MKLSALKSNPGARKDKIRVGRGNGSKGTFSGKGCKGQNARSGGGVRPGFEGGQTPLLKRMPKRDGFRNPNRIETEEVNLLLLEKNFLDGDTVSLEILKEKKLVSKTAQKVKLLGTGTLSRKLTVSFLPLSKSVQAAVEKAGGKIEAEEKKSKKTTKAKK